MDNSAFVGAWRLVSEMEEDIVDGLTEPVRGNNPPGLLIYQADGMMAVQLMRAERSGDIRDLDTALDQYLGYYGRYSIDEVKQTVTHHLEGSSYLPYVGTDLVRHFALTGNRLTLTAEVIREGQSFTRVLTWERV